VSDLHGVLAAADALLAEGLPGSQARHARIAAAAWAGVEAMGLRPWPVRRDIAAACVTAIAVPDGLTDIQVRDHARACYGVQLSAGQGAGNILRLGHMGATARPILMIAGLAAIGRSLADLGANVDIGAGLDAALAALSATGAGDRR
jgi:pyridoxamine--pyruvate transaminase